MFDWASNRIQLKIFNCAINMSELGSKGGKGLGKEGAKRHGKVLQCGCIKEDTKPILSGFTHQGGINGVLNQEPCAFIKACIADAKAELEAEEIEKVFVKTCLLDAITEQLQDEGRDPKRPVG